MTRSTGDSLRLGAYILAADPTWLRSSLRCYYDDLDVLVVLASSSERGWTGAPVQASRCVDIVREVDVRGIAEVMRGDWTDPSNPMAADTAQRQAGIDAIGDRVDWILQLDTDELLPDLGALREALSEAESVGVDAVEWPMRVLFRRLRTGAYVEVVARSGRPRFEYPGPVAVRPRTRLVDARRSDGGFLRPVVRGDTESLQIARPAAPDEVRELNVDPTAAILHNSWARSPKDVRAKVRSWGHGGTWRAMAYYWLVWWPSPVTWRWLRSFHPFARDLWPRLRVLRAAGAGLPRRLTTRNAWRSAARTSGLGSGRGCSARGCRRRACTPRRPW